MAFSDLLDSTAFGSNASTNLVDFSTAALGDVTEGDLIVGFWTVNASSITVSSIDDDGDGNVYDFSQTPKSGTTLSHGFFWCRAKGSNFGTRIRVTLSAASTRTSGTLVAVACSNKNPQLVEFGSAQSDAASPVDSAVPSAYGLTGVDYPSTDCLVIAGWGWKGGAVASGFAPTTPASLAAVANMGASGGVTTRVESNVALDVNIGTATPAAAVATYTSITAAHTWCLVFSDLAIPTGMRQLMTSPRGANTVTSYVFGQAKAGSVLLFCATANQNGGATVFTDPAGWTLIGTFDQASDEDMKVWMKVAAGGETGLSLIQTSGVDRVHGTLIELDGTVYDDVQDGSASTFGTTSSVTTGDTGTATPSGSNRFYLGINVVKNSVTMTGPAGYTALPVHNEGGAASTNKNTIGLYVDMARGSAARAQPTWTGGQRTTGMGILINPLVTITPISCAATQAQSAAQSRRANRVVPATQAQSATQARSVGRKPAATQAQAAAQSRRANRIAAATQAQVAACVALATRLVSCAATQAQAAAYLRSVGRRPAATQDQAAAQARQVGVRPAATQAQAAACARSASRACAATQAQAALVVRSIGRLVSATQAQAAAYLRSIGRSTAASQAQAAAQTRSVGRRPATTQGQSCGVSRGVSHSCPATQAQLAAYRRTVNRLIAATQAQSADCIKIKVALVSCAATQAQAAASKRIVLHSSSATQAQAASTLRSAARSSSCTQPQAAAYSRQVGRRPAATQPQAAAAARSVARLVAATQPQAAQVTRAVSRACSTTQPQACSTTRSIARRPSATQPQAAVSSRRVNRVVATTQPQVASCTAVVPQTPILVSTTQAQVAAASRRVGRAASATQRQAAAVSFVVVHPAHPIVTAILVETDPSGLTIDGANPEPATTYRDAPTGGVFSDPQPREVG